jgi:hypothetical protein
LCPITEFYSPIYPLYALTIIENHLPVYVGFLIINLAWIVVVYLKSVKVITAGAPNTELSPWNKKHLALFVFGLFISLFPHGY